MKPLPRHRQAQRSPACPDCRQAGRQAGSGWYRPFLIGAAVALLSLVGCAAADPLASVVRVNLGPSGLPAGQAGGTGFIVGREGDEHYVLTARHVVRPPIFIVVQPRPGAPFSPLPIAVDAFSPDERVPASILRLGKGEDDIALLAVRLVQPRPLLRLADDAGDAGEPVRAYGCPNGQKPWWAFGFVTGCQIEMFPPNTAGFNAVIWPGFSGGPVVSGRTGHAVGMTIGGLRAGFSVVPGVSAMIPGKELRRWLRR